MLWHSFGTIAALLQEIVNIYPAINPPNLTVSYIFSHKPYLTVSCVYMHYLGLFIYTCFAVTVIMKL